jgi:hypothetical protein
MTFKEFFYQKSQVYKDILALQTVDSLTYMMAINNVFDK